MEFEEWRDIEGYPGYYVSSFGNVRGPRKEYLKLVENNDGYLKVTLSRNGIHKDMRVNRLVATAFLDNPDDLPLVMHIDNDPKNNHMLNLAWGTYADNNRWCRVCGRASNGLTREIIELGNAARRTPVIATNIHTGVEQEFASQHDAARELGLMQQHIWGVLNGYRRSTGGYHFRYVEEELYD